MRDYWERAKLDELRGNMSRTAFMLRFTLSHPDLDTTIVGTRSIEHLRDNVAALPPAPSSDLFSKAKKRLTGVGARPVQQ